MCYFQENQGQGSRFKTYAQVAKNQFLGPRPQGLGIV